jgi:hypothetical protein
LSMLKNKYSMLKLKRITKLNLEDMS